MKPSTKIYAGLMAAALLTIGMLGGHAWSGYKTRRFEAEAKKTRRHADEIERTAATLESEAAIYKEKIGYLEAQLSEARNQARTQDEQLERLSSNSRGARVRVARARGRRTDDANKDELCQRLAAAGHPCER